MNDMLDTTKDRLTDGLNEQQHEAVTMGDDDVIILAGAGSGKTRVLTSRIAWLMREGRADPKEILAVTFTNKASKEMKDRLGQLVATPINNMWIGTFHGLCHRMLRENAKIAGLPAGFTIMDADDQTAMIKRMLKEMTGVPEDIKPKELEAFINKQKEQGIRASSCIPNSMFDDFAVPFYASYEARCARQGTIDFAELQLRTSELLQTNEQFRGRYENKFSHILVDEFQDTNLIQYDFLKILRGDRACVFAVGDDDQSIYGFRGSNPQNMTDFVDEIAKGKVVRLEQNYRSTGNILGAANALIEKNAGRLGKNLWTDSGNGSRSRLLSFARDMEEADQVGIEVKNWMNKGVDPSQIAILYRSNHQSRAYEKALMSRGVPYVIHGGTRFFERMEIKNALAYLKLALNYQDDISFRRVVNFPPRGLGEVTVDAIANIANQQVDANGNPLSLLEAAATCYDGKAKDKVADFVTLIVDLVDEAQSKNLHDFIEHVIKVTGLKEVYEKNAEEEERARNLGELLSAARNFCEESEIPDAPTRPAGEILGEFLASASLESAFDKGNTEQEEIKAKANARAVTLMTVHSAKGLEFDKVIIGGAEENIFPNKRSLEEGTDEEERRLMYVAITRARQDLIITHSKYRFVHGEKQELEPSRFLREVPPQLFDQHRFPSDFWVQDADGRPKAWGKKGDKKDAVKNPFASKPPSTPAPAPARAEPDVAPATSPKPVEESSLPPPAPSSARRMTFRRPGA
jgi:DNA helicase-2/ATP-dependent DNA helicase PcrA